MSLTGPVEMDDLSLSWKRCPEHWLSGSEVAHDWSAAVASRGGSSQQVVA